MGLISRKLLHARPQELGKIKIGRLGAKKGTSGGKEMRQPVKLDHFVVTTRHRGDDGNFVIDERIHAHPNVGPAPTELEGVLMFEDIEENFHSEMVQYSGRTQTVSCDGEEAKNLKTGRCYECPRLKGNDCPCKPYSRLALQLWASPYTLGYHLYRSTGWQTANNIQGALEGIYQRIGTLLNAPVRLVIYPAEDRYKEGAQEKTSTSYKVGLVLAMSMEETLNCMVEAGRRLHSARAQLKLLAAGVGEHLAQRDREEAEEISREFFPDPAAAPSIETRSTLDSLKEQLGVGREGEAPTVEGDFEPEEPHANGADQALVRELQMIIEAVGSQMPEGHVAKLRQAIEDRDEAAMRAGLEWIKGKASTNDHARLKIRRLQARERELLDVADEEAIEESLESGDPAAIRMWIAEIDSRIQKAAPAQASLLES
jgi:hypothetical protein